MPLLHILAGEAGTSLYASSTPPETLAVFFVAAGLAAVAALADPELLVPPVERCRVRHNDVVDYFGSFRIVCAIFAATAVAQLPYSIHYASTQDALRKASAVELQTTAFAAPTALLALYLLAWFLTRSLRYFFMGFAFAWR